MSFFAVIGAFVASNGGPVAVGVVAAQVIARAIPDNKKGVLGTIRKVAKTIGLYHNPDLAKLEQAATFDVKAEIEREVIRRLRSAAIPSIRAETRGL